MNIMNALASEQAAIVGVIKPDATTAATYFSDYIDMLYWEECMAIVLAGDLGASATVNAKIVEYTAAGVGAHDISGKAMTQFTQSPDDSNKQAIINVRREDLNIDGGFRYIRLSMTVATATSDVAAVCLGFGARRNPASDNDLTTVDEIVN